MSKRKAPNVSETLRSKTKMNIDGEDYDDDDSGSDVSPHLNLIHEYL